MARKKQKYNSASITSKVKGLPILFTILKIICILLIIFELTGFIISYSLHQNIKYYEIFVVLISLVLFFGFQKKKQWIIPVSVCIGTLGIINDLLTANLLGLLFSILWIYFFSRKPVKAYFHYQGTTIF